MSDELYNILGVSWLGLFVIIWACVSIYDYRHALAPDKRKALCGMIFFCVIVPVLAFYASLGQF